MILDIMNIYPIIYTDIGFTISSFHTAYEYQWDEHYTFPGEQHNFWEIVYVISGEVEVAEDERVYKLKDRNIIFHAPMEFHKIRSLPGSSPHIMILTFSAKGLLPEQLKDGVFSISLDDHDSFYALVRNVINYTLNNNINSSNIKLSALDLSSFIITLTSSQTAKSKFSHSKGAKEYHNIVVTMSDGIYDNLTLNEIATKCHVSISYIKLLFSQYSGISPKAYYSNMRFNESVRLLYDGYSVTEVSEILNFSSPNYFSVFFKNQCGMPPAKYIKNKR